MQTMSIPGIGIPASRLCLGTGSFGSAYSQDESFALMDTFAAQGGTFLDSAHIYASWLPNGEGASERTIGAWLISRGMSGKMVIATKGGHPPLDNSAHARLRPDELRSDLMESLQRLGQPSVDLYWLHRDDPSVPCDEVLAVLEEQRAAGRIRAYGASNWCTARLELAARCAASRGWPGFVASQIGWSLADARPERIPPGGMLFMDAPTLAWHQRSGLQVIPYSSQANGFFTKATAPALYDSAANASRKEAAQAVARQHGCSANTVALAWLMAQPCARSAIIGPRTIAQLLDSIAGDALTLTSQELRLLSA